MCAMKATPYYWVITEKTGFVNVVDEVEVSKQTSDLVGVQNGVEMLYIPSGCWRRAERVEGDNRAEVEDSFVETNREVLECQIIRSTRVNGN